MEQMEPMEQTIIAVVGSANDKHSDKCEIVAEMIAKKGLHLLTGGRTA